MYLFWLCTPFYALSISKLVACGEETV